MPAYVVAMMTITDPAVYRQYTDRTPPTVKRHGGRFLTRGEPIACVEGERYAGRMVILEFPGNAEGEAWLADPRVQGGRCLPASGIGHASADGAGGRCQHRGSGPEALTCLPSFRRL